ncbi:MAG: glycosylase, partial [Flavobacterium sp.]
MFEWEKLGRIYNPHDFEDRPEWMFEFAQAPSTVIFDDFVRVYLGTRPKRDPNGQYVTYTSFIDLDRNNLFNIINIAKEPVLQ